MRPFPSLRVASLWPRALLILWAGCASPDPAPPSDASLDRDARGGSTPAFYACSDTAQCVDGTACTNWGSDTAYCRPLCTADEECQRYPYTSLRCQDVVTSDGDATGLRACNDGPRTVLVTRESPRDVTPVDDMGDADVTDDISVDVADVIVDVTDVTVDIADVTRDIADVRDACVAQCTGRSCGPDGCGGSCGPCGFGRTCTDAGACSACVPDCEGRRCGPDGCGGVCGRCADFESCSPEGACVRGTCGSACRSAACGDAGTFLGYPCSCGTCRGDQRCVIGQCTCGECPNGTICYQTSCCRPDCTARECGTNGCGGSCGECRAGLACNDRGRCVCVPRCTGRVCGSDGCLGSCGTCTGGQACTAAGTCCTPSCSGRRCGANGCGGSCGTCPTGQSCNDSGQCVSGCVPNCTGRVCGSNGCGGSCGTCSTGSCDATGRCVSGGTCSNLSSCLSVSSYLADVGYCRTVGLGTIDVLPVMHNSCSSSVYCRVCGTWGASARECEDFTFSAGQSVGGWASFFTWCNADGVAWVCTSPGNPSSCLDTLPR